ncbi:MAG: class I SAM-dependent methyltransferase [Alphaproteobacteria bacterium]
MSAAENIEDIEYFARRRVSPELYQDYQLPAYLKSRLPLNKGALIVDFGCGMGRMLKTLKAEGYTNVVGIDIEEEAVAYCRSLGLNAYTAVPDHVAGNAHFVIMNHVLEHLKKEDMVPALKNIRNMLASDGRYFLAVPNAQSPTGAYWRYEDFTHEYLFTSGSLWFVLKTAGFSKIEIIDIDCTEGLGLIKTIIRKFFLTLYKMNYKFWNKITSSGTQPSSEDIFSFEIKAICHK